MALNIPDYEFKGIPRIEIPHKDIDFAGQDLGESIIKKYLPKILSTHSKNSEKINYLFNYYLGLQDILNKKRLYNKDAKNNNKEVENHAYRHVTFKRGFITSERREYTHKADTNSDDLIYLDRYFTDISFFSQDKDLKEWVYATGVGITHTAPRTDIIVSTGVDKLTKTKLVKYKTKNEGFDVEYNAPFTFYCIDPRENFVVYSSGYSKEPLFCVSIVEVDVGNGNNIDIRKQIHIETRYASFLVQSDLEFIKFFDEIKLDKVKVLNYLPMIEYCTNRSRLGLVELNKDVFNLINTLNSSIVDMTVDNANIILVFKNTDIDKETVEAMNEAGAIIIHDSQEAKNGGVADLDTIKLEIPFEGFNSFIEKQMVSAYDIAGVPLASGQVTSGGDTGQARLLGGGWNNAYIIAYDDINSLLKSDYEQLKLFLMLSKQVPGCPLNELNATQIDIKYRINQNDNLLVKTQGMMNLYSINLPKDEIIKASGLFGDVTTVSRKWEDNDTKIKQEQNNSIETIKVEDGMDNRVLSASKGNNSQE